MIQFAYPQHQALWNSLPHGVQHVVTANHIKPSEERTNYTLGYLQAANDYLIINDEQHDFLRIVAQTKTYNTTNGGESNHD